MRSLRVIEDLNVCFVSTLQFRQLNIAKVFRPLMSLGMSLNSEVNDHMLLAIAPVNVF